MANQFSPTEKENPLAARSYFYIARLVIRTLSPLSIGAGIADGVYDNLLVRDANGLPAIPGSSFAGVLRHLYTDYYNQAEAKKLFGIAQGEQAKSKEMENLTSAVHISWGCIHNSKDKPIQGLLDPTDSDWRNDVVLSDALQAIPIKRDHVKITSKGVASTKGMAKFDRVSLTTGHRFSIELSLWSENKNDPRWQQLLNLIGADVFRLGGKTRSGLGKITVERCHHKVFDLKNKDDLIKFQALSYDLAQTESLDIYNIENKQGHHSISVTLYSEDGGYRFGSGIMPVDKDSEADLVTLTEQRVVWKNNQAFLNSEPELLIPASSIKGALRHRTAYYYYLLTGKTIDGADVEAEHISNVNDESNNTSDNDFITIDNNSAIEVLFGYTRQENGKTVAKRGQLIFNDCYIPLSDISSTTTLAHNSIDRFTGGVREAMLFFEEVIHQKKNTPITFSLSMFNKEQTAEPIIKAFEMALDDLTRGRLALGAGSGRIGSGYFSGQSQWQWHKPKEDKNENDESYQQSTTGVAA